VTLIDPSGNSWDWFFVAMARCQKGEKDETHFWFDMAVAWTKQHDLDNPELLQFWTETGELLGRPGPGAAQDSAAAAAAA
jgi:hypothetical protein